MVGGGGRGEGEMEGEPSPEALILSQGLPNLTGTICIWEEWITIPQRAPAWPRRGVGKRGVAEQTHKV